MKCVLWRGSEDGMAPQGLAIVGIATIGLRCEGGYLMAVTASMELTKWMLEWQDKWVTRLPPSSSCHAVWETWTWARTSPSRSLSLNSSNYENFWSVPGNRMIRILKISLQQQNRSIWEKTTTQQQEMPDGKWNFWPNLKFDDAGSISTKTCSRFLGFRTNPKFKSNYSSLCLDSL